MSTILKQLGDESFPPQVFQYARGNTAQVMNACQQVNAMVEKAWWDHGRGRE